LALPSSLQLLPLQIVLLLPLRVPVVAVLVTLLLRKQPCPEHSHH
jgi:hypothetical protein